VAPAIHRQTSGAGACGPAAATAEVPLNTTTIARLRRAALIPACLATLLAACGGQPSSAPPKTTTAVQVDVSGLAGGTLVLQDNGADDLAITASGTSAFATRVAPGSAYSVTVKTQPAGQACTVSQGSGTASAAGVTVAVSCIATGVGSSTTSSTAFAVLATSTARVAFLPGDMGVVPVSIDGTAVTAAAATSRDARAQAFAPAGAALVSLSFSPDSCTVDSNRLVVSCISYNDTKLAFLDVAKFANTLKAADITATEFDSGAPADYSSFSGGNCILCGIVAVTGQGQIVVAASDGYRVYAYPAANAASPLVPVQTFDVPITENFAVDPVRRYIAASEYWPANSQRALRLIDMKSARVYRWNTATDTCAANDAPACTADFQSEETDAETFDVATGMLVLQSESGNSELMLDLSQATFDQNALTFAAPHQYVDVTNPYGVEMSGALASPSHSYLFLVPEFASAYAGVEALPAAGTGGAFPSPDPNPVFVDLNVYSAASPCGDNLESGGDPHSQGFTTTMAGTDVGLFITSDRSCIVKVDLKALYEAPRDPGDATHVAASYDLVANHVLTYLKVQ
jgi:hypothetical protein